MSTVSINNLSVSYPSKEGKTIAIQNLSLHLCDGGIYTVIGPSGCGKSTLLHTLGGIITGYQGEILMNGERPDLKRHSIGLVPQNYGLLPWKKVKENIFLASHIRKQSFDESFANEVIHTLELGDLLNRFPNELSGGQQQRVALARSFIQQPDLLLMDEPFSALDTLTAEKCRNLFLQIWKKHKVTTLFITHNIEEAVKVGKYIILLSKCPGTLSHVIENPILQPGADRSAESCLKEATRIRELIKEEWI